MRRTGAGATVRLTADQARRLAIASQGLADGRPTGPVTRRHLRRVTDRVGVVQIDSVNVLARAHELAFFARLGRYPRSLLQTHIERHRAMFEYWGHVASFIPIDLHPALRWRMTRLAAQPWGASRRDGTFRQYIEAVHAEVAAKGPLTAAQLDDAGESEGSWWGWRDGKLAVEYLFVAGRVTAAGRRSNFERVYDLPERVIPPDVLARPALDEAEGHRHLLRVSARALGVATARDLADYFRLKLSDARPRLAELAEAGELLAADVDGWAEPAYLHPEATIPRRVDARALLSPFDSLVWERTRTERLFGMRYRIEIYTPAPKRVYGYYVLPFLLGDQLVARVDLKADRQAGTLRVPAAYAEAAAEPRSIAGPLAHELRLMADWLELDRIEVDDRGDLARDLRREAG
jgi:uncharacterized protein YcaQ